MMTQTNIKSLTTVKLNEILQVTNSGMKSADTELQVLIFTNFGHIQAKSIEFIKESNFADLDPVDTYLQAAAVKGAESDKESLLLVHDAKITPFGFKEPQHVITHMLLFADQIVGLSFK